MSIIIIGPMSPAEELRLMPNAQGTVAYCGYKNIQTKRGNSQIWSFKIEGNDNFFKCGFTKPVREDGVRLLAGDLVKFSFKEDQYGLQVDMSSLKVKIVTPASAEDSQEQSPSKPAYKPKGNFQKGGGAKDDYWEKKEQFDKTVTQPLIMRQAANNVAAQLVTEALSKDVLPLPSKKADKFEAYMLCYEQLRNDIFTGMMKDYETLKNGGSIMPLSNVTDEEDPSVDDFANMDDIDDTPPFEDYEQNSDDW